MDKANTPTVADEEQPQAAHSLALPGSPDSPTHPAPSTPTHTATESNETDQNSIVINDSNNSSGVGDDAAVDNIISPPSPLSLLPPLNTPQVHDKQATSTPTIPSPAPSPVPVPAPVPEEGQSGTSSTSEVIINMTSQTLDPKYIHLLESYNTMKYIATILVTLGDDLVNEVLTPPSTATSEIEVSIYIHHITLIYMCTIMYYSSYYTLTLCTLYHANLHLLYIINTNICYRCCLTSI